MTARWRDTINVDDLWEGDMTVVMIDGEPVLLVNIDGTIRAYSNQCPHQASPLDEGDLDGETLTCGGTCGSSMRPLASASTRTTRS